MTDAEEIRTQIKASKFYGVMLKDREALTLRERVTEKLGDSNVPGGLREKAKWLVTQLINGDFAAKIIIIAALIYFIQPLDLIPDMIPVAGYADDLMVVGAAVAKLREIYEGVKECF